MLYWNLLPPPPCNKTLCNIIIQYLGYVEFRHHHWVHSPVLESQSLNLCDLPRGHQHLWQQTQNFVQGSEPSYWQDCFPFVLLSFLIWVGFYLFQRFRQGLMDKFIWFFVNLFFMHAATLQHTIDNIPLQHNMIIT